jgi:hypothetical protein
MTYIKDYARFLSKFAFIFLIFVVISSGYLKGILSCQMQNFLKNISTGKHLLGIIIIFVFIMLEGGWSFNQEENDMADNDWSSGNAFDSLIIGTLIYIIFIISSKSRLIYNITFFIIVFILYITNTQRSYYYVRKLITDETNNRIITYEKLILYLSIIILIIGFIDYIIYQKQNYKSKFSWYIFLMGVNECTKLKNK